jgi:hypothetical protein
VLAAVARLPGLLDSAGVEAVSFHVGVNPGGGPPHSALGAARDGDEDVDVAGPQALVPVRGRAVARVAEATGARCHPVAEVLREALEQPAGQAQGT